MLLNLAIFQNCFLSRLIAYKLGNISKLFSVKVDAFKLSNISKLFSVKVAAINLSNISILKVNKEKLGIN